MKTQLGAIVLVIIGTFIGMFAPVLLKKASGEFNRNLFQQLKNFNLILGLVLYVLSAIVFVISLRGGDLSLLYPLVSVSYVWVSLLSIKFLREKMNKYKWTGIAFIILGVSLIGLGSA